MFSDKMHPDNCCCKSEYELTSSYVCLRDQLDVSAIRVFNSDVKPDRGSIIFKRYCGRMSEEAISSNISEDGELLFTIPFINPCNIGILLAINESDVALESRLYANRPQFDFGDVDVVTPTQTLEIPLDLDGSFLHRLNATKFRDVTNLAIYFVAKDKESHVKLRYIGLRGSVLKKQLNVVDTKYELIPSKKFEESFVDVNPYQVI